MRVKLLVFACLSIFELCQAKEQNPYDAVGKCSESLKENLVNKFDIDEIANTGDYYYVKSNALASIIKCASAKIFTSPTNGKQYGGSNTVYYKNRNKAPFTQNYTLPNVKDGIIDEELTIGSTSYKFKLYVLGWENGVFYYHRCSDKGTNTKKDIRSIVIKHDKVENNISKQSVINLLTKDGTLGFKSHLAPVKTCIL